MPRRTASSRERRTSVTGSPSSVASDLASKRSASTSTEVTYLGKPLFWWSSQITRRVHLSSPRSSICSSRAPKSGLGTGVKRTFRGKPVKAILGLSHTYSGPWSTTVRWRDFSKYSARHGGFQRGRPPAPALSLSKGQWSRGNPRKNNRQGCRVGSKTPDFPWD